ncbi:hypothetical protein [Halorhabdus sp. BNX81]|uniref:hypothetical protein n=1 Tax=Halorhabdus sp. BNX81 TaxID=2980181 RepID=UPI0023DD37A4|nr:hypothetical protein [Halorhabdus sp. BNX81]WEL20235.1 Uncharacterized protein HBNXHr_0156 [Halorhabdus sp. BNX81]
MRSSGPTRRQVLAGAGAVGASGLGFLGYSTDNPVHRSSIDRTETRQVSHDPDVGEVWVGNFQFGERLPEMDLTQLIGVQYGGRDSHDYRFFDVIGVTITHGNSGADRPSFDRHWLDIGSRETRLLTPVDPLDYDSIQGGALVSPAVITENLPIERGQLDDPSVIMDLITSGTFTGTTGLRGNEHVERDLELIDAFLNHYSPERSDRLTRTGLLYALHKDQTTDYDGHPDAESERGYLWHCDSVAAHVVQYEGFFLEPSSSTYQFNVSQRIPRPSILGDPTVESTLSIEISP